MDVDIEIYISLLLCFSFGLFSILHQVFLYTYLYVGVSIGSGWSGSGHSGRVEVGSRLKKSYPNPTLFELGLVGFGSNRVG